MQTASPYLSIGTHSVVLKTLFYSQEPHIPRVGRYRWAQFVEEACVSIELSPERDIYSRNRRHTRDKRCKKAHREKKDSKGLSLKFNETAEVFKTTGKPEVKHRK